MMNRVAQIVGYIVLGVVVVALLVGYGFCRGRYDLVPRGTGPVGPPPVTSGPTHVIVDRVDGDVKVRLATPLIVEQERTVTTTPSAAPSAAPRPAPKRPRSMTVREQVRWRVVHEDK